MGTEDVKVTAMNMCKDKERLHRYIALFAPEILNSAIEGDICLRTFGSDFNFKPAARGSFCCRLKGSWSSRRAWYCYLKCAASKF